MKPPLVPKLEPDRSVVPSGFRIEIFAEEQQEVPIVTSESLRLTRSPARASKRSLASSPGDVVVTVTGSPPGTMVGAKVAVPATARVSEPPGAVAVARNWTAPAVVGVKLPL